MNTLELQRTVKSELCTYILSSMLFPRRQRHTGWGYTLWDARNQMPKASDLSRILYWELIFSSKNRGAKNGICDRESKDGAYAVSRHGPRSSKIMWSKKGKSNSSRKVEIWNSSTCQGQIRCRSMSKQNIDVRQPRRDPALEAHPRKSFPQRQKPL